ncbi:peptide transporter (plasmid) [Rhodococcus sp. H-CA8f]|jgi:chromosome partitioning protein|uniref:ParA family protein n=2 Tax=Rhodococcus erythropolis group TaxID=2840174 RepID=A0AAW6LNX8_RHOSG|nr:MULTISPECIES: ParA family protein [Rhodococcus]ATI36348.1 peptide transporter [Rhodococcus sp. H-CA8f]MDE8647518.1 ParA family protein [Rhodococcus qingshengii]
MAVYVLLNQKGGVGKSTLTVNLAAVTAEATQEPDTENQSVLAVSVDPQGSATWWSERVDDLPFVITQEDNPETLRGLSDLTNFSSIFVDTPGWLGAGGDDPMIKVLMEAADLVVIPTLPQPLAFDPTARTVEVVQSYGIPYVVVINGWDPRDGKASLTDTQNLIKGQGWPLAKTVIRQYRIHTNAAAEGRVVTSYPDNKISFNARSDFQKLALELATGRW